MPSCQGWVTVARADHFRPGSMQRFEVCGQAVVVFQVGGSFYGLLDCCTHDGGDLSSGTLLGGEIICPRHGARFEVTTGRVLSPPAYEDATVVAVRVCDEMVQIQPSHS